MLILVLNRPFLAYRCTETLLCLSCLFMLTSANIPFYACQAFLCLTDDEFVQIMPIIVEKKWNGFFSKRRFFWRRSVRLENLGLTLRQMTPFRFTSLKCSFAESSLYFLRKKRTWCTYDFSCAPPWFFWQFWRALQDFLGRTIQKG